MQDTGSAMNDHSGGHERWETFFQDRQEMWGWQPAPSAQRAHDVFLSKNVKSVLIPGIGYGRNAQVFVDSGMDVTGIEISSTAIDIAQKHFGNRVTMYLGSVTDMPYDDKSYDGIFCYALIHLLDTDERKKLIQDCYHQLNDGGTMIFVAITKDAPTYGKGQKVGEDRYELHEGIKMYFYDLDSVEREFDAFGLQSVELITEQFPFYFITCTK